MREVTTSLIETYGLVGAIDLIEQCCMDYAAEAEKKKKKKLAKKWDDATALLNKVKVKISKLDLPEF